MGIDLSCSMKMFVKRKILETNPELIIMFQRRHHSIAFSFLKRWDKKNESTLFHDLSLWMQFLNNKIHFRFKNFPSLQLICDLIFLITYDWNYLHRNNSLSSWSLITSRIFIHFNKLKLFDVYPKNFGAKFGKIIALMCK